MADHIGRGSRTIHPGGIINCIDVLDQFVVLGSQHGNIYFYNVDNDDTSFSPCLFYSDNHGNESLMTVQFWGNPKFDPLIHQLAVSMDAKNCLVFWDYINRRKVTSLHHAVGHMLVKGPTNRFLTVSGNIVRWYQAIRKHDGRRPVVVDISSTDIMLKNVCPYPADRYIVACSNADTANSTTFLLTYNWETSAVQQHCLDRDPSVPYTLRTDERPGKKFLKHPKILWTDKKFYAYNELISLCVIDEVFLAISIDTYPWIVHPDLDVLFLARITSTLIFKNGACLVLGFNDGTVRIYLVKICLKWLENQLFNTLKPYLMMNYKEPVIDLRYRYYSENQVDLIVATASKFFIEPMMLFPKDDSPKPET